MAGKKVTVDFTAPELSSLGGLTLVREYEKSSSRIIERIESCIKDPRWEPMVIHSQTEMLRQRIYQIMADFEDADTYGTQQLTLFNAYYGEYCYMPLLLFEGRSGKLILPILRPGRLQLLFSRLHGLGHKPSGRHPLHHRACRQRETPEEMISVLTRLRHLPPS